MCTQKASFLREFTIFLLLRQGPFGVGEMCFWERKLPYAAKTVPFRLGLRWAIYLAGEDYKMRL